MAVFRVFLFIFFLFPSLAMACRCPEKDINHNYKKSSLVAYVVVKNFIEAPSGEGGTAVVEISQWWKSSSPKIVVVNSLTNCAQKFDVGTRLLLFMRMEQSGLYYTDRCSGNRILEHNGQFDEQLFDLKRKAPADNMKK